MNQFKSTILAAMISGTSMIAGVSASAATPAPSHIRGTISSVSADEIIVHTTDGTDLPISLTGKTKYLEVVKSNIDKVAQGSYIGTATKSVGSTLIALEVSVFPPAYKGVGEGHYPWDKIPDTTLSGSTSTASSMTNGSVTTVAAPEMAVNSSMTNGSIAASSSGNGVKTLTVTYKGGQQTILVPPTAPIVTFRAGSSADLTQGAPVFVQAFTNGGGASAGLVMVGMDGVKPPM